MKRYLLTAASALVITAAASAQTAQITGQVTASLEWDGTSFIGPNIGQDEDDELALSFTGSGGGWDYSFYANFLDDVVMTFENTMLGSFELTDQNIEWSRSVLGEALEIGASFQPNHIEAFTLQLSGNVGGVGYEASIANDAMRSFEADIVVPIMDVAIGASLAGNLSDTSDFDYDLEISTNVFGVDAAVYINEVASIGIEAYLGAFGLQLDATDGDLLNSMIFTFDQDVTERMTLTAYVNLDGVTTTAGSAVTLAF